MKIVVIIWKTESLFNFKSISQFFTGETLNINLSHLFKKRTSEDLHQGIDERMAVCSKMARKLISLQLSG